MIWSGAWASAWQSVWNRLTGADSGTVSRPAAGALTFSGYAPTIEASAATTVPYVPRYGIATVPRMTAGAARVSFVGHMPTVEARIVRPALVVVGDASPPSSLLVVRAFAPTVRGGVAPMVRPLPPSIRVTRYAPTVVRPRDTRPGAGGVTWLGHAPRVPLVVDAAPMTTAHRWAGYAPEVEAEVMPPPPRWSLTDDDAEIEELLMLVALL